jgi:hypothetical protein
VKSLKNSLRLVSLSLVFGLVGCDSGSETQPPAPNAPGADSGSVPPSETPTTPESKLPDAPAELKESSAPALLPPLDGASKELKPVPTPVPGGEAEKPSDDTNK